MISEKLLSEVLNVHLAMNPIIEGNDVGYLVSSNGIPDTPDAVKSDHKKINIYELSHKCKEWAYDNKYSMLVQRWRSLGEWVVHISGNGIKKKDFIADTEPEAVFQACEWILEQKEIEL